MPVFSEWVSDPLFFKRCLVLHVDLALIVWFFSFAAALYSLLPGDQRLGPIQPRRLVGSFPLQRTNVVTSVTNGVTVTKTNVVKGSVTNSFYVYQATLTNLQPGAVYTYVVELAGGQIVWIMVHALGGRKVKGPELDPPLVFKARVVAAQGETLAYGPFSRTSKTAAEFAKSLTGANVTSAGTGEGIAPSRSGGGPTGGGD
jgi:hypothetical protein